ncbi:MAG TPA: peptidylprolyl isomerase, partial [Longimicrobiaceae bacterium]|nr:peptidylprolyl isomerase [Longimicrobiaceae bacterium]
MKVLRKSLVLMALGPFAGVLPASAQGVAAAPTPGEDPDLADRVVAVVGDSIILLSEVRQEMFLMVQQQNIQLPTEPEQLREAMGEVLENLIDVQLILQEAARDTTLRPADALIEQRAEQHIAQVQSQVGGVRQLQEALAADGMSMTQYREEIRSQILRAQVRDLFMQRRLADPSPVVVTDEELRDLYDLQREQLQARPEVLTFDQIILRPTAPDSSWERARATADSLLTEIRGGADFAELASEWSDDPGSAANGGDLGWFRRGVVVRDLEVEAFRLPPGGTGGPVRTQFGWHLIRVERTRPGEVKARHILLRPEPGQDDLARSMQLAR